ncbi:hypothetical protein E4T47_04182 [Aureobasidium subglaciale]|nr:hypothetical protein E4T47_04182 [Aureobasidium subglaciale]
MAACRTVEAYAAAQVFHTVGNTGLQSTLGVFIADTSSLKNRGLMQAIASSPNMITCWLAGPIASGFLSGSGWPWAFGMFSIMVPGFSLPLFGHLFWHFFKAKKLRMVPDQKDQKNVSQSIVYYGRQFDAIGLILLFAGVALFLLPFNIYALQSKGWASPLIICLLVFGFTLMASFVYTVVSGLSAIAAGAVIRYTGRFKLVCMYIGLPLIILGTGLLIHFRRTNTGIGYIVMCQIFIGLAQGIIVVADEIAALAAVSHQHIAVTLATIGIFGSIGGAIGLTVVATIWQTVFPKRLALYLPEQDLTSLPLIYADLTTQLSYEIGSPTRIAIQRAYGDTQRDMALTATVVWVLGVLAVGMWRDIKVSDMKQVRGHVI